MKCCICDTDNYCQEYRNEAGYDLLRCKKCSLVYLKQDIDPVSFIDDAQDSLQGDKKQIEYWSFPELYKKYALIFKHFFQERLKRCKAHNSSISSMFDVGTGYGFWMDFCRRHGIEVKGIDISEEVIKYAQNSLRLDVECSFLKDYKFSEKYDLYTLCDVLEHFNNPNANLTVLYGAMNKNALLYIQVPDVIGLRIPYRHNLGLPHHLWQFNYHSLKKLLKKNGFCILKRWHGVQGVIGCYEKGSVNIMTKFKWYVARKFCIGNRLMVLCCKK